MRREVNSPDPTMPTVAGSPAMQSDAAAILATIASMTGALADGDVAGIMGCYSSEAVVLAEPGEAVSGADALGEMFAGFIASGMRFSYGAHDVVVAGDTGLHLMQWTAEGPDGPMRALSVAVLRRQADGAWRMVIDHPFGDGVMAH